MMTDVPPAAGPPLGITPVTVGAPYAKRSLRLAAEVCPETVTKISSARFVPGGATTVSDVLVLTTTSVPTKKPKCTVVDPETKLVPVTVTTVPPASGP
jgi:hypothetical protein